MKTSITIGLVGLLLLLVSSCNQELTFHEDFNNINDRVWISPDLWSVPLEDWQVANGRLECMGTRTNMRVTLLTYSLADGGDFQLQLSMGLLEAGGTPGSGGLILGMQDDTDPSIPSLAYFGTGVNAGVDTDRNLFLGEQTLLLPESFSLDCFTLKVNAAHVDGGYELTLQAEDDSGLLSEALVKTDLDGMYGAIALVNNHQTGRKYGGNTRFWFDDLDIQGGALVQQEEEAFGPILWSMYTLSRGTLKMSAQMPPLGDADNQEVVLEVNRAGQWEEAGREIIDPDSRTAVFRVEEWDATLDQDFRLLYLEQHPDGTETPYIRTGTIRRDPVDKPLVLGGLTCQYHYGFPYQPVVDNLTATDPDMLYFSGDQIYEGNGGYGIIRFPADTAILNYLGKWYMFGWAFGDLMRDRPTVCTPDDHDVYHGNLWGQDADSIPFDEFRAYGGTTGGYVEPAAMVNAVHRTQSGHLPDPPDPQPRARGISVYHAHIVYGRVSFAVVTDRGFKSGPYPIAFWEGRKDWFELGTDDYSILDSPELKMLGDRQMKFLRDWSRDWEGADLKCLLSQTTFANVATHHGGNKQVLRADLDSGGWPRSGRNRVLEVLRSCFAFHVSGDQHLPSLVQYGIDDYQDGGWGFCTPAIANYYERRFQPERLGWPISERPEHGLPNTGKYLDGFGNPTYVYAIGNPVDDTRDDNRYMRAQKRSSGFGVIRFDQPARKIDVSCYRFLADTDHLDEAEAQFPGWPLTLSQQQMNGLERLYALPELTGEHPNPVIEVIHEATGELLYTYRISGSQVIPWVNRPGTYTVKLIYGEGKQAQVFTDLVAQ